jgi:hypothetical protein
MEVKCAKCGHPLETPYDFCECNFAEFDKALAKFVKHAEKLGAHADRMDRLAKALRI